MRLTVSDRRKIANAKYNNKNPGISTTYRHEKLAKKGKIVKSVGRPKKKKGFNFNQDLLNQNRALLSKCNIQYDLENDEGVESEFRLKKSSIHGFGVYLASNDIPIGSVLMQYRGEIIGQNEADNREKKYISDGIDNYLFEIMKDGNIIDATKKGNIAKFINHSCLPNCETATTEKKDGIIIYALRNIKYGEEITIDYNLKDGEVIQCKCGARECRGRL